MDNLPFVLTFSEYLMILFVKKYNRNIIKKILAKFLMRIIPKAQWIEIDRLK